ncbi:MAG: hypothetical protein AAF518_19715 [Spirochaetota bacterium]
MIDTKMYKFYIYCFLLALLSSFSLVRAKEAKEPDKKSFLGFAQGKWFVSLGAGKGWPGGHGIGSYLGNQYFIMDAVALSSQNKERIALAIQRVSTYRRPRAISKNIRFGAEYSFADHFSFGGSFESTTLIIDNLQPLPINQIFGNLLLYPIFAPSLLSPGVSQEASSLEYLGFYQTKTAFPNINTLNIDLGIHPLNNNRFDPFLTFSYGMGPYVKGTISRISAILGLRVYASERIFLFAEGQLSNISISFDETSYNADGEIDTIVRYISRIQDRGYRFGVGFKL